MRGKRTNLYRARRKLLKGLALAGGATVTGRTIPDSWRKPVIESATIPAHAQTTAFALGVVADPPPGGRLSVGDTIQNLTCTIDPPPTPGDTVSYLVVSGGAVRGPFTLPLDAEGRAHSFFTVEKDYAGQSQLTIKWRYRGTMLDTSWELA